MESFIPAPTFTYSLSWAAGIVDQLVAKYARATEMVCEVYGITSYDLVKYLAKPDPMWDYLRNRIKAVGRWEERLCKPINYETLVEWEWQMVHHRTGLKVAGRLDNRLREQENKRAGMKGGGSEATAERSPPSFLSSSSLASDSPGQLYFDF